MFDPATYSAATNTRQPFAGNVIPRNRFDRVSEQAAALYPAANLPGTANNYFANQLERVESNQFAGRVDHQITPRDTMFGRFIIQRDNNVLPSSLPPPSNLPTKVVVHPLTIALSETHTFSAAMVNELRLGFTRSYNRYFPDGDPAFPNPFAGGVNDLDPSLPNFNPSGFAGIGTGGPPASLPIAATGSGNHSTKVSNVHHLMDNVSVIRGRHSIKFGGDLQLVQYNNTVMLSNRPGFTFDGRFTNNPAAAANTGLSIGDFLLGLPQNVDVASRGRSGLRQRIFQAYLQDDWKVSSRLTINAGLRWELAKPFFEVNDRQANFIREQGESKPGTLPDRH
jgi:hypothetical protein